MNKNEFAKFCGIIKFASDTQGEKEKSEETLYLMFEMLKEYRLEDIGEAVKHHIKTSEFPIKIANIVQRIEGSANEKSSMIWCKIISAIKKYGRNRSLRFDDPRAMYAIKMLGGWERLCNMPVDQQAFVERNFTQTYSLADKHNVTWETPEVPKAFLSLHDTNNIKSGYHEFVAPIIEISINGGVREIKQKMLEDKEGKILNLKQVLKNPYD